MYTNHLQYIAVASELLLQQHYFPHTSRTKAREDRLGLQIYMGVNLFSPRPLIQHAWSLMDLGAALAVWTTTDSGARVQGKEGARLYSALARSKYCLLP